MEQLRLLFEELDLSNVETFIASGNVIFESSSKSSSALEKKIEKHLKQALGYEVATFIRTPAELTKITEYKPFATSELENTANSLYISFLPAKIDKAAQEKVLELQTEIDEFHFHGRELYWLCRKRFSESLVSGPKLNKALGVPATARNVTTVRKLAAKYAA